MVELGGRLAGRIALITGASRGIGAAVAKRFAAEGAHVILTARTTGALEEVDDAIRANGGQATLVPFDMLDYEKIDQLGGAIAQRFGRLDVLVGNAGVLGVLSPLGHIEPKVWEQAVAVNVTANWRLIRSMDPLLRASEAGRAVFISSGAAHKARAYWGLYAVCKAGLEMLARTYAAENETTSVRVNLVNPGPVRTKMRAAAMPGEDPSALDTPEQVAAEIVKLCRPDFTENGKLYDYPGRKLVSPRAPA